MEWKDKTILLVGGTGSFGRAFLTLLLTKCPQSIRIYSRDEYKQSLLLNQYGSHIRGFIGDIRDKDRLSRAMSGCDMVIHCAALKQVQSCEYNPLETIKTNIMGSMNIIDTALDHNVEKVLAISTDKAVNPLNLYGATKMCMERLFTNANNYRGKRKTKFACTRYGNVVASRGTIVPLWRERMSKFLSIPITNLYATRFWIGMKQANEFVADCVELMDTLDGGEIFVPQMPSVIIKDVYMALTGGKVPYEIIGDRIGDKMHETLVSAEEVKHTITMGDKFVIYPEEPKGWNYSKPRGDVCEYTDGFRSDNNRVFLDRQEIERTLEENL